MRAQDLDQELADLDPEPLQVVATTTDLAYLARRIGGKRVQVRSLIPPGANAHYQEARPDYTLALHRADLFIINGLELEVGWVPPVLKASRNIDIQPGRPGFCDASQGIRALEIPDAHADRSQGDVHPGGNPHYMLDPVRAAIAARNIGRALVRLDGEFAAEYSKNYENFASEIKAFVQREQAAFAPYRGLKVAVYHKEFIYLAERFGLDVRASLEEVPGVPPSAAYLKKVTRRLLREKVGIIILAPYNRPDYARSVAQRINARVLIVPTSVGQKPELDSYQKTIAEILRQLRDAARPAG